MNFCMYIAKVASNFLKLRVFFRVSRPRLACSPARDHRISQFFCAGLPVVNEAMVREWTMCHLRRSWCYTAFRLPTNWLLIICPRSFHEVKLPESPAFLRLPRQFEASGRFLVIFLRGSQKMEPKPIYPPSLPDTPKFLSLDKKMLFFGHG
jgi:hypothetical protein